MEKKKRLQRRETKKERKVFKKVRHREKEPFCHSKTVQKKKYFQ